MQGHIGSRHNHLSFSFESKCWARRPFVALAIPPLSSSRNCYQTSTISNHRSCPSTLFHDIPVGVFPNNHQNRRMPWRNSARALSFRNLSLTRTLASLSITTSLYRQQVSRSRGNEFCLLCIRWRRRCCQIEIAPRTNCRSPKMMAAMSSAETWGRAMMTRGKILMDGLERESGRGDAAGIYNGRSAVYDNRTYGGGGSWQEILQ